MKTFGRILLILTAFAIVMGLTYLAVNSGNTVSPNARTLDGAGANFRPNGEGRPPELRGAGGAWVFGMIKNVGIVAFFVTLIVFPKNLKRKRNSTATFTPR